MSFHQRGALHHNGSILQSPTPRPYVTTSVSGQRERSGVQTGGAV